MKKTYSFDSNQITIEVLEDFKKTIWDPDYTDFELKSPTVYPHNIGITGFNDQLCEIFLEALSRGMTL